MAEGDGKGKTVDSKEDIAAAMLEFEKYVERQKESLALQKKRATLQGEFVAGLSKSQEEIEKLISKLAEVDQNKLFRDGPQAMALFAEEVEKATENIQLNAEDTAFLAETLHKLKDLQVLTAQETEKLSIVLHRASKRADEAASSIEGVAKGITSLVGGLNLGITSSTGFASNILKLHANMQLLKDTTGKIDLGAISLAIAGEALIGVVNKIGSEIATLAQESAKASAELAKLSGASEASVGRFMDMTQGLYRLGVSADSFTQTAGALMNQTAMLGNKISEADEGAVRLAAQLVTLGVDAGQLAETINLLSRGFGMSLAESTKFYESLIMDSKVAGQSVADLSKNFQEAQARLSATSSGAGEMKRQFAELNKMTKELGVSMSTLTGLAAGFDKFGDAADKVGKLNAQFNLGLSMTRMMNASDAQRIQMLRQAFAARGLNVAQMGKYEKLHIQSILNAKDEAEMLRMLGQSRSAESDNVQNMNELLEAQQGAYDKLKNSLKEFAANFSFVIEMMTRAAEITAEFFNALSEMKGVLGTLSRVAVGLILLASGVGLVYGAFSLLKKAAPSEIIEKTGEAFNKTLEGFASVIDRLNPAKILALGGAMLLLGAGIGLAGYGFSFLAEAMAKMGPEQALLFVLAVAIIVGGMYLLLSVMAGPQGLALLGAIAALGTGILYLGGAIALVGFGLSMMFNSIGNAAKELVGLSTGAFTNLISGLYGLAQMGSPLSDMVDDLGKLNEAASNMDGLVISQTTGNKHTVMMASENILKGKSENSFDVNVKISMDDLNVKNLNTVKVYLDSKELTEAVAKRINTGG